MNTLRWKQVDELFHAAVSRPAAERARFLEHDCPTDLSLRAEVESLLAAHERASSDFIEQNAFDVAPREPEQAALPIEPGQRIGRYALRGVLGRGGAGTVYEAEQDDPARTVALKVMRALPYLDDLTPRLFRREGQALARLDHPGIAAIHEAGTDGGCHYFAMERVVGAPLTQYARERSLLLRDRLELFRRVCDAVHYAHQRGVIHLDLKPSNILVTETGQPKVLDFGLARITDPDAEFTCVTESGSFRGTLAYSSPEQLSGRANEIDVRSDIYSLGVILYELLSGQRPYELGSLSLPQAARVICEQPPRPLRSVDRAFRGDLETIVQKALEREPQRRYQSAHELSADIDRYRKDVPIAARPASATYLLRKFVRRHRAMIALVAAAFVGLLTLTMYAFFQAAEARAQRRNADLRSAQLERVVHFQGSILRSADPRKMGPFLRSALDAQIAAYATGSEQTTQGAKETEQELGNVLSQLDYSLVAAELVASTLFDDSLEALELQFADDPLTRATLRLQLGWGYLSIGHDADAIRLMEAAWRTRQTELGEDAPESCEASHALGTALRVHGDLVGAEARFARCVVSRRAMLGPEHPDTLAVLSDLAGTHEEMRLLTRAANEFREVLRAREQVLGPDDPTTIAALADLTRVLLDAHAFLDAAECLRQRWARVHGGSDCNLFASLRRVAEYCIANGDLADAVGLAQEACDGLCHHSPCPDLRNALLTLGQALEPLGRFAEAEKVYQEMLELDGNDPRGSAWMTGMDAINLARTLTVQGRARDALPFQRQAVLSYLEYYGANDLTLSQLETLLDNCLALPALETAREVLKEVCRLVESRSRRTDVSAAYDTLVTFFQKLYAVSGDEQDLRQSEHCEAMRKQVDGDSANSRTDGRDREGDFAVSASPKANP